MLLEDKMENALNLKWDLNYGELASDTDFTTNIEELKSNLIELQKVLEKLSPIKAFYDTMPLASQIELDLLFAFTLNSLFWIQMKLNGVDISQHPIKYELLRIKSAMKKWQDEKDKEKRPTVDIAAAKRFIKSGLYDRYRGAAGPDPTEEPVTKMKKVAEGEH